MFLLVSPSGRDVAQRQRGLSFYFQFYPSTAGAVPLPFQGRLNLAPLKGELSRSDGGVFCGKTEGVCQIGKMRMRFALRCTCSRVCPLSHLLRKCQLSQRESQEGGANRTHASSGYFFRRPARVLLLPSRLAPRHLPQRGRLWSYTQTKLVSPSGRDVAQRQRGQAPSYAQTKLVSPFGRDVAQRQRGLIPANMFFEDLP